MTSTSPAGVTPIRPIPTVHAATPRARAKYLPFPRLESIRSRILAFAVLAALLPSGAMLGISYTQNRRALEKKVTEDLLSQSAQSARATGVWLKERLLDLRVFAISDEVMNTLDPSGSARNSGVTSATLSQGRLRDYLLSLHERFGDFEQLMVLDLNGKVVASSGDSISEIKLPDDWKSVLRSENQLIGETYWDQKAGRPKLVIAVPAQRADGRLVGAFAAELNLAPVRLLLRSFTADTNAGILIVTAKGSPIETSEGLTPVLVQTRLAPPTIKKLLQSPRTAFSFTSFNGRDVIGTLEYVPQVNWAVVSQVSSEAAFSQVRRFRDIALLVIALLLLLVSATGYRLGLLIARPLDRLAKGAGEVAAGDLAVDLPEAAAGGEVGYLTDVFNHMVSRLREGRRELDLIHETLRKKNEELEMLSTTDSLTGLDNHRSLMQRLDEEEARCKRERRSFSVLVGDVDHFKQYNDAFGHPAGDEVLKAISDIMRDAARPIDCVARYGGEEFVVLMPDTGPADALELAEHIRARVAAKKFTGRKMTLSIGVAAFPEDADNAEALISIADEALYQAKREGRDRAIRARKLAKTGS
jgi:diguanylate cyclase (GGDEF)-like protein